MPRFPVRVILAALVSGSFAFATSAKGQAADPAPPAVQELAPAPPPPPPQKNPDASFRGAPKPLSPDAAVTDWASFLGPNHNLVVPETKILDAWPEGGPRAVWEVKKGSGYAAPAVVGESILLFHRVGNNEVLDCLRATTGERHWRIEHPTRYRDRYGYSDGPRASPVVADGLVYTLGAEGRLRCVDLPTGRVRWSRDLRAEFKLKPGFFGCGSTPLVEADKLVVNVGAPAGGPCVAAFDLKSGKLVWGAGGETGWGMSYASPVPATIHGKRRVLVFAGGETDEDEKVTGGLLCVDPATGAVDFTFPWRGNRRESVNASGPLVVGENRVFISECYGAGGALVEITPDMKPRKVWSNQAFGTHFMVALHQSAAGEGAAAGAGGAAAAADALAGHLYGVDGHGPNDAFLACVEAATGKELWRTQPEWKDQVGDRRLTMGTYRAHLLRADGKTFMLGEFGHLLRVELTPQGFAEKQRAWLFAASETWTPPVLSRGLLYVCQNNPDPRGRTEPRLICCDLRAP